MPARRLPTLVLAAAAAALAACDGADRAVRPTQPSTDAPAGGSETFFPVGDVISNPSAPVAASAVCTAGGDPNRPLIIPAGYEQTIIAREPQFADLGDMQTLNQSGPDRERYLYRTHETGTNGSLSVTDLLTGRTRTVAQRADWERLDGIAWTPWRTVLFAEETGAQAAKDPAVPEAVGGLMYEFNPETFAVRALPAVGARSHEGIRLDPAGNLYGISETNPGFIFKFIPDFPGDLTGGQLYALKVIRLDGDRTGDALWIPLDRAAVRVNSTAAAAAAGATGYNRPEDVELATNGATSAGGRYVMYVAVTGEHRVLAVDLRARGTVKVAEYVKAGVNAPPDFEMPDNLALDHFGNLFITEDPGGDFAGGKRRGDDVWRAAPSADGVARSPSVTRFSSLTDCDAEPTGIYLNSRSDIFFLNVQHRGGDGQDYSVVVTKPNAASAWASRY